MIREIFLLKNGRPTGPFSSDDLRTWYEQGIITNSDVVWYQGLEEWISVPQCLGSGKPNLEKAEVTIVPPSRSLPSKNPKALSFVHSIPGLMSCALGALSLLACFQIVAEVWRYSDRPRETQRTEKAAMDAALALDAFAKSTQEATAMEYERIRRDDVNNQIRQTRQDWNDYQIFHMTPEQRADEVNRQTLNRINGR